MEMLQLIIEILGDYGLIGGGLVLLISGIGGGLVLLISGIRKSRIKFEIEYPRDG